jgi:hypothetical protein
MARDPGKYMRTRLSQLLMGLGRGRYVGVVTEVVVDGLVAGTGLPESALLDGCFAGLGRAGSRFLEPP